MPTKRRTTRFANDDFYDIVLITDHEIVPTEGRDYIFRRTIMYVPKSNFIAKVETL